MRSLKEKNEKDLMKNESKDSSQKQLITKKKEKNKKSGKFLLSGIVTILLVIILIDIYILVNIGLDKITLPEFDFTENKVFSLSDETKTKFQNLET